MLESKKFYSMPLSVTDDLVTEHVGDRMVSNIVGYSYPSSEELDGQMGFFSDVHEEAILFVGAEIKRYVGRRLRLELVHCNERILEAEVNSGEILAVFASVSWRTLAHVVLGIGWHETDAVLAVILLAGRSLLEDCWPGLTEFSREVSCTLASVLVGAVNAGCPILTQIVFAVVDVDCAIVTSKA